MNGWTIVVWNEYVLHHFFTVYVLNFLNYKCNSGRPCLSFWYFIINLKYMLNLSIPRDTARQQRKCQKDDLIVCVSKIFCFFLEERGIANNGYRNECHSWKTDKRSAWPLLLFTSVFVDYVMSVDLKFINRKGNVQIPEIRYGLLVHSW